MEKFAMIFLFLLFSSACTIPETNIYSLHIPIENETKNMETSSEIPSVAIVAQYPRYLSHPYIAYRKSPYQLKISRYSKWESSPGKMVREKFKYSLTSAGLFNEVRISNITPEGFYSLKIDLRRFERVDEGDDSFGELAFNVAFYSPEGKGLYSSTISKRVKLERRDFSSLAKGLSSALEEGINEVRQNIEHLVGARSQRG
jgi:uncharacterized lipoprotein YmbA